MNHEQNYFSCKPFTSPLALSAWPASSNFVKNTHPIVFGTKCEASNQAQKFPKYNVEMCPFHCHISWEEETQKNRRVKHGAFLFRIKKTHTYCQPYMRCYEQIITW